MRSRSLLAAVALLALSAAPARAQGSIFGLRGLGWLGRGVSARSAATGGALDLLDPEESANPAALARFRSVAGWAVGAPTTRTFTGPVGSADLETTRFPLMGFAAVLPTRTIIGVTFSDFLDRTWTITRTDSQLIRGVMEKYTDAGRSLGGVSDMALAAGYRASDDLQLGVGFHYYLGSSRLTSQRLFDTTTSGRTYSQVLEESITDYRGFGASVGVIATFGRLDLAASARLNGRLRSANTTGVTLTTQLPAQFGFSARLLAVPGVFFAGSAQFAGWHAADADLVAAGKDHARNVWALGGGIEVLNVSLLKLHTPLRLGYRWRQLPFESLGQGIDESALSGGVGFSFARDRTTLDLGFEHGNRKTGAEQETFTSAFVGITVRP